MDTIRPARALSPENFFLSLTRIDNLLEFHEQQRNILRAIILNTPNLKLLDVFLQLTDVEVAQLATCAENALKALRSWGGRPDTSSSSSPRTSSPSSSRPGSPIPHSRGRGRFKNFPSPLNPNASHLLAKSQTIVPYNSLPFLPKLGISKPFSKEVESMARSRKRRSKSFSEGCSIRQHGICALSGCDFVECSGQHETAHLFPYSAIYDNTPKTAMVWEFLVVYLGEELRDMLAAAICSESKGINSTANRICMLNYLHRQFDTGKISLVPFEDQPVDKDRWLDVRLRFVSPGPMLSTRIPENIEEQYDQVPVQTGAGQIDHIQVLLGSSRDEMRMLKKEENIRMMTQDPERYPLPSSVLLKWHAHIWQLLRAASMSESSAARRRRFSEIFMGAYDGDNNDEEDEESERDSQAEDEGETD